MSTPRKDKFEAFTVTVWTRCIVCGHELAPGTTAFSRRSKSSKLTGPAVCSKICAEEYTHDES
jgi:hypothetical protein